MADVYVWLRYSSSRQLTWQRNFNTQPRILSAAQVGFMCGTRGWSSRASLGKGGAPWAWSAVQVLYVESPNVLTCRRGVHLHRQTTAYLGCNCYSSFSIVAKRVAFPLAQPLPPNPHLASRRLACLHISRLLSALFQPQHVRTPPPSHPSPPPLPPPLHAPPQCTPAQERLTRTIAEAHARTHGEAQEWVRMMLTTVGRGGDGQRIR